MKKYIIENLTPICIGFAVGILTSATINAIADAVVKIALIHTEIMTYQQLNINQKIK